MSIDSDIQHRYEQARVFRGNEFSGALVRNDVVYPHWIEGCQKFWYKRATKNGWEFRVVDAEAATNTMAFDHAELASAISDVTGQSFDPHELYFDDMTPLSTGDVVFSLFGFRWSFDAFNKSCNLIETLTSSANLSSPDGKKIAFSRGCNLWVRDNVTGGEYCFTEDGDENNVYGYLEHRGEAAGHPPSAIWSPNSRYLLSIQSNRDAAIPLGIVSYAPRDEQVAPFFDVSSKAARVGSDGFESVKLILLDIYESNAISIDYPNIPMRVGFGNLPKNLGWWSSDSKHFYFVDKSVDHKEARVVEWDIEAGVARVLFKEQSSTFVR